MRVCVKFHSSELVTPFESHNERIVTPPPYPQQVAPCVVEFNDTNKVRTGCSVLFVTCHSYVLFVTCHFVMCHLSHVTRIQGSSTGPSSAAQSVVARRLAAVNWCVRVRVRVCVHMRACMCLHVRARMCVHVRACMCLVPVHSYFSPFYHPHPSVLVVSQILKRECAGCGV